MTAILDHPKLSPATREKIIEHRKKPPEKLVCIKRKRGDVVIIKEESLAFHLARGATPLELLELNHQHK